jgi:hypothetical protein
MEMKEGHRDCMRLQRFVPFSIVAVSNDKGISLKKINKEDINGSTQSKEPGSTFPEVPHRHKVRVSATC